VKRRFARRVAANSPAIACWLRRIASLFKSDAGKSSAGFPKYRSVLGRHCGFSAKKAPFIEIPQWVFGLLG
jgi:hypothetical protein